jgi:hypothetical protein
VAAPLRSQLVAADHPDGDLASVRDQHPIEHGH